MRQMTVQRMDLEVSNHDFRPTHHRDWCSENYLSWITVSVYSFLVVCH